jgi:integrase
VKRGNSWRARVNLPDGKQANRSFRTKAEADRWQAEMKADLARGTYIDPRGPKSRFEDYAGEWLRSQVHRPATASLIASHFRNHIYPTFGARQIGTIRPSDVQAWVKGRSDVLAPATVRLVYSYLASVFRSAVRNRDLGTSPCDGIVLPKVEKRRVEPMAVQSVHEVAAAVPAHYRAAVLLAAGTGMRQGEVFGLTLSHVDFLRRTVRVEQQLLTPNRGPASLGPPKTSSSRRTVPLPQVVVDELARHLERFPVRHPWGLVFTTETGKPVRRTAAAEMFRAATRAARLDGPTWHDLRHFYASLLIRHGESVKVVQARLGHASASETLDTYSHLWPDSEDRTRAAIDGALALGTDEAGSNPGPDQAIGVR